MPQGQLPRVYDVLNRLARTIEPHLRQTLPKIAICSRETLAKRTTQAVVDTLLNPFLRERAARVGAPDPLLPPQGVPLTCAGLRIDAATGATRVTWTLLVHQIGEFLLLWFYTLMTIGKWVLRAPAASRGAATLLYGVGRENLDGTEASARFQKFCSDGPIAPLRDASRVIVQLVEPAATSAEESTVEYGRFPLQTLLLGQRLQPALLLRLVRHHFSALAQYLANLARAPLLCMLARDYAEQGLARALNECGLIENVILTNSNYARQPLWMTDLPGRRYRLHIVWYSVSASNPLVYRDDPVVGIFPLVPFLRADELWFWTRAQADFYSRLGVPGQAHVVGPVLWYLPEGTSALRRGDTSAEYRIALFDVTPTNRAFAQSYGLPYNYYDARNVAAFIEDIVFAERAAEAALGRKVAMILKNKRTPAGIHDDEYLSLLRKLTAPDGPIQLVPPETNLYSLISESDVTVVIPFSSPAYVADHLKVPAIYHDATGLLAPIFEPAPHLTFTASREELTRALVAALRDPRRHAAPAPQTF